MTLIRRVIDQLQAGSIAPRVTCENCGAVFIEARILYHMQVGQDDATCPQCKAVNSFHGSTSEELARAVPRQSTGTRVVIVLLSLVAAAGIAFVLYALFALRLAK